MSSTFMLGAWTRALQTGAHFRGCGSKCGSDGSFCKEAWLQGEFSPECLKRVWQDPLGFAGKQAGRLLRHGKPLPDRRVSRGGIHLIARGWPCFASKIITASHGGNRTPY